MSHKINYVQTFDMTPEHDLHLTHHLFGDDRGRGPALIDLSEHYKGMGLELEKGEIPDYLPLILEFVSTLDEMQARVFLGDAAKVLKVLAGHRSLLGVARWPHTLASSLGQPRRLTWTARRLRPDLGKRRRGNGSSRDACALSPSYRVIPRP